MSAPAMVTCPHCGHEHSVAPVPLMLSKRQAEILAFVQRSIDEQHVSPSYDEIRAHFGLKSAATVNEHLVNLEKKGWIRRQFNASRSIELLHRLPHHKPDTSAPATPNPDSRSDG